MTVRKPQRPVIQFLLIMMLFLSGSSTASQSQRGDTPLVQINNEVLTVKEFQEMTGQLPVFLRAGLETVQGRRKALDWLIDSKLMLAEALQRGARRNSAGSEVRKTSAFPIRREAASAKEGLQCLTSGRLSCRPTARRAFR